MNYRILQKGKLWPKFVPERWHESQRGRVFDGWIGLWGGTTSCDTLEEAVKEIKRHQDEQYTRHIDYPLPEGFES